MKKDALKISILLLILLLISSITILLFGKTHTVSFNLNSNEDYEFKVDKSSGDIAIVDEIITSDDYIVKVKSKKPGKVFLSLNYSDRSEVRELYIHKSMIITDNNYFGKCRASEIIPISLSIILIYILYILIKKYNYHKKDNLYQYKNIAYLGIIIFISMFTLNNILSIFDYHGLYETINGIIGSTATFSILLFPLALITFTLVTISNIKLIKKEGLSPRNLLGLLLGILICLATIIPDFVYNLLMKTQKIDIYNLNSPVPYIYNLLETIIYLSISYLECILIGTIIIAIKSVKKKITYDKEYLIILGCQIKKDGTLTPLLKGRVDRAIEFRNEQINVAGEDLIFIPSGGKGKDEIISEAEAMKNYLISKGINKKQIMLEDKSKNTYENIKFSNKLINDKEARVAFSTTNYHVLRAGLIATEQGLKMEGIGSKTKAYFWVNAFIREFIGTLYAERKKHLIVFVSIIIAIILMITITYFANNI